MICTKFKINLIQKEFRMRYFVCGERNTGHEFENDLRCDVGPINIDLCGYTKKILLTMNSGEFTFLWEHFFSTVTPVWKLNKEEIVKVDDLTYEIPLTFDIALMYLEYNIVFWPTEVPVFE